MTADLLIVNFFLVTPVDTDKNYRIVSVMEVVNMTRRVGAPGALAEQRGRGI